MAKNIFSIGSLVGLTTAVCGLIAGSSVAVAQGMKVSTVVYNAGQLADSGREPILASSVCLFHAGKAYDYVESVGEVVILEPSERRCRMLNPSRGVFTVIQFEEVQRLLDARGPQAEKYLEELKQQKTIDISKTERSVRFQLNPDFQKSFDERSGTLVLKNQSPSWTYVVSTHQWDDTDQLQQYLDYANWMARLNYVLHPSSMFPEPRLKLNESIRELKNRMPVVVQLSLRPDEALTLRAEHRFTRGISDQDRRMITEWTAALNDGQLKELPFRQYQERSFALSR